MKHRVTAFAGMALGVIGTAVLALAPVGAPSAFAAPSSSSVTFTCGGTLSISWSYNKPLSELEYIVGDLNNHGNVVASGTVDNPPETGNYSPGTVMVIASHTYSVQVIFVDLKNHQVKSLGSLQTMPC